MIKGGGKKGSWSNETLGSNSLFQQEKLGIENVCRGEKNVRVWQQASEQQGWLFVLGFPSPLMCHCSPWPL